MKVIGSRYAQHFNKTYQRTGTLWEGRHRSSTIDTDNYLLTCYRYVELNPVRAEMVAGPAEYRWSSYRRNALGEDSWLTSHSVYDSLGVDDAARRAAYQALFERELSASALAFIRAATHYSQPIGDDQFRRAFADRFKLSLGYMKRGRPQRAKPMVKN